MRNLLNVTNQLDAKLAGNTLEQQIKRYVLNSTWSEERDNEIPEDQSIERRIIDLAKRAHDEFANFLPLINELTHIEGNKLYQFGLEIGRRDKSRKFLKHILDSQCDVGDKVQTQFIGGYLLALREASESDWEALIIKLLFDEEIYEIAGQLIWRTGVNDNVLRQMLKAFAQGVLKPSDFTVLRFSQNISTLNQGLVKETLSTLLTSDAKEASFIALEIADTLYNDKNVIRKMPMDFGFDLLTTPDFFADDLDTMQSYHWGELAKTYITTYPGKALEIFKSIMTHLENWRFMTLKTTNVFHSITEQIAKANPAAAWKIIETLLGDLNTKLAHGILRWLEEELSFGEESGIRPLTYFPMAAVFKWIDGKPGTRAPAIARAVPKTLDQDGDGVITRELLDHYGHIDHVKSVLDMNFLIGGWSGPASEHHRQKRDEARGWLNGETSHNVIEWLENYIDSLTSKIEREEIREERDPRY